MLPIRPRALQFTTLLRAQLRKFRGKRRVLSTLKKNFTWSWSSRKHKRQAKRNRERPIWRKMYRYTKMKIRVTCRCHSDPNLIIKDRCRSKIWHFSRKQKNGRSLGISLQSLMMNSKKIMKSWRLIKKRIERSSLLWKNKSINSKKSYQSRV